MYFTQFSTVIWGNMEQKSFTSSCHCSANNYIKNTSYTVLESCQKILLGFFVSELLVTFENRCHIFKKLFWNSVLHVSEFPKSLLRNSMLHVSDFLVTFENRCHIFKKQFWNSVLHVSEFPKSLLRNSIFCVTCFRVLSYIWKSLSRLKKFGVTPLMRFLCH